MDNIPAIVTHAISLGCVTQAFSALYEPSPLSDFAAKQYGGQSVYLTVVGLAITWIYFALALHRDFTDSRAAEINAQAFGAVAVPLETLISILYWGIKTAKPELMIPPIEALVLPIKLDLALHLMPVVLLWFDFLVFQPPFNKSLRPDYIAGLGLLAYCTHIEIAAVKNGRLPYPFLRLEAPFERLAIYVASAGLFVVLFKLINGLHVQVDRLLDRKTVEAEQYAEGEVDIMDKQK
ncbi:uncharacterized protein L969DRAFT_50428 [Mixia osmundae IAM 14324]|nr:uncharacterized protein L969DRAFT_50428 [Mixia osmundae IAM 14324]KEI38834.1 hypothetical protein L969DRAFT_50428 [Mixia osmundae IAM 14324]